jgi:hypothetical protein
VPGSRQTLGVEGAGPACCCECGRAQVNPARIVHRTSISPKSALTNSAVLAMADSKYLLHVRALMLVMWPLLIATAAAHTAAARHPASTTTDHADDEQYDAHNRENVLQIHIRLQTAETRERGARCILSARIFRSCPSHCRHLAVYEASYVSLLMIRNRPGSCFHRRVR